MRIWHEKLISKLCQKHLCAMWREANGAYKIITENKKGYRNHPAVKEFENAPARLYLRLEKVRNEMLYRGYNPMELPKDTWNYIDHNLQMPMVKPWQTLEEQIEILKSKKCDCKI